MQLDQLKRREFIWALGGALAWPLTARAQQLAPVIGYLSGRFPAEAQYLVTAFEEGLRKSGFIPGRNVAIEFRKVVADEISGDWDAVADAGGQPFPFTLSLKLDGDKVTGSSSSQLGTSNISSGSWKDGKLAVLLESGAGQIVLNAVIVDGKFSGDYDFAGQSSGKWVAVKKK